MQSRYKNVFLCYLQQLFHWAIHVNGILHCFCMWNRGDVRVLCLKDDMHSQHILHHLDWSSAYSDDGHIIAFQGMTL